MMNAWEALTAAGKIMDALEGIDDLASLFSILGLCIDTWAANHDEQYDVMHEALVALVEAHEEVNMRLGAAEKTA